MREKKLKTNNTVYSPSSFKPIQERFEKLKQEGTDIILEVTDLKIPTAVKMKITYVGTHFCKGDVKYVREGKEVYAPYTILYADVHSNNKHLKIITKGKSNPYGGVENND